MFYLHLYKLLIFGNLQLKVTRSRQFRRLVVSDRARDKRLRDQKDIHIEELSIIIIQKCPFQP